MRTFLIPAADLEDILPEWEISGRHHPETSIWLEAIYKKWMKDEPNPIMNIRCIGMSTKRTAWERFEEDSTSRKYGPLGAFLSALANCCPEHLDRVEVHEFLGATYPAFPPPESTQMDEREQIVKTFALL